MAVGHKGQSAENTGEAGALSSSTMTVTITANTPSVNAVTRSAVMFSRIAFSRCCKLRDRAQNGRRCSAYRFGGLVLRNVDLHHVGRKGRLRLLQACPLAAR